MFVLQNSFIIFTGISEKKEKWLKRNGILTWDDLFFMGEMFFKKHEVKKIRREIKSAKRHLKFKDIKYFIEKIENDNLWIIYEDFKDLACFLDIETTGLGELSELTILGVSDSHGKYRTFVKGINFEERNIIKYLKNYKILITFYGTRFDVPFIRKRYPRLGKVLEKMVHIDLCFLGHKVGFKGGLKSIERQIGIVREEGISGLTGLDAVQLWEKYRAGDKNALITLIRYNREDVINLIRIIGIEIEMMKEFYS